MKLKILAVFTTFAFTVLILPSLSNGQEVIFVARHVSTPIEQFRQPEVEDLDDALVWDFQVGGFQVSVDHTLLVGKFQSVRELHCDA